MRLSAFINTTCTITMTEKEFSILYKLSRNNFERIAFSYVYDAETARDIVSDCFVYLWEHRKELTQENIKGYIYFTLRSRCISWLRKQQSGAKAKNEISGNPEYRTETSISSLTGTGAIEHDIFSSEIMKIFRKTLNSMPDMTRKVFTASRHEELTYQEIASKYNITVRKVTSEIQRALRMLRTSLKDY